MSDFVGGGVGSRTSKDSEDAENFDASFETSHGVRTSVDAITASLPGITALNVGRVIEIVDVDGNADVNNITITADGSDLITGASSVVINSPYAGVRLRASIIDTQGVWKVV